MFIGHYGLGFAVRKKTLNIPLWQIFLGTQLLDFIAFALVMVGIEKADYIANANPFFRNDIYLPYSHSLSGAVLISLLVYFIVLKWKSKTSAIVLSLVVFSHWIIDFIVHPPDLTLFFGYGKVGLGLWNLPMFSYGIEIAMVIAGWIWLKNRNGYSIALTILMIFLFSGMIFGRQPEAVQNNTVLRSGIVLLANAVFVILSYFAEKEKIN